MHINPPMYTMLGVLRSGSGVENKISSSHLRASVLPALTPKSRTGLPWGGDTVIFFFSPMFSVVSLTGPHPPLRLARRPNWGHIGGGGWTPSCGTCCCLDRLLERTSSAARAIYPDVKQHHVVLGSTRNTAVPILARSQDESKATVTATAKLISSNAGKIGIPPQPCGAMGTQQHRR